MNIGKVEVSCKKDQLHELASTTFLIVLVLLLGTPEPATANLAVCGDCICIEWATNSGIYIEVRCTETSGGGGSGGGWTPTPPPSGSIPDNDGSFGGTGAGIQPPAQAPPGTAVPLGTPATRLNNAIAAATGSAGKLRLRCHKDPLTQVNMCWETTCTAMFLNNKLHMPGLQVAGSVVFRYGQSYSYLKNGQPAFPCTNGSGTIAFVDPNRGPHDRYIFLCAPFFDFGAADAAEFLIHEMLHVAGQGENGTVTAGPGDPPNSNSITEAVSDACGAPAQIGQGYLP